MRSELVLLFLLLLAGCMSEPLVDGVPEGEPAVLGLSLEKIVPDRTDTRATNEDDVYSLHIWVFDSSGWCVSRHYIPNWQGATLDQKRLRTLSGSNMKVCVLANGNDLTGYVEIANYYNRVHRLADSDKAILTLRNKVLVRPDGMLMSGKLNGVTINPGSSRGVTLPLKRVSSKITIIVSDETPTNERVEVLNYEVKNMPVQSYVNANSKDYFDDNLSSGATIYDNSDVQTFEDVRVGENKTVKQGVFYLLENRRGEVSSVTDQKERGKNHLRMPHTCRSMHAIIISSVEKLKK